MKEVKAVFKAILILFPAIFLLLAGCKGGCGRKSPATAGTTDAQAAKHEPAAVVTETGDAYSGGISESGLIKQFADILPSQTRLLCLFPGSEISRALDKLSSEYNKIFRIENREHLEKKLGGLFAVKPPLSADCLFASADGGNFAVVCREVEPLNLTARSHYVFHNSKMYYLNGIGEEIVFMFEGGSILIGTKAFLVDSVNVKLGNSPSLGKHKKDDIGRISAQDYSGAACHFLSGGVPFVGDGGPGIKGGNLKIGERRVKSVLEADGNNAENLFKWLTGELDAAKAEWEKEINELVETAGFLSQQELKLASGLVSSSRTALRDRFVIFEADEDPLPFLVIRHRAIIQKILDAAQ